MKEFLLVIFLKIIVTVEATKPKSVNIALETVLEFDHKNNDRDVKFIDNVQEFLDKVKKVIHNNPTARRHQPENKNIKFTDFIKSVIDILKNYDDDDLEDVFAVFDDEIRKYHNKGSKFYELLENQNMRRFVANKLEDVKDKSADELRQDLDNTVKVLEDAKFSGPGSEFLEYINSLYRKESEDKLRKFLSNLQTYKSKSKRANTNLIKVVQDGARSIIFDHYSKLNATARRNLKIKLETSWNSFKNPDEVERNVWTGQYKNRQFKIKHKDISNKRHNKQTTESIESSKLIKDSDEELATERYNDRSKIANDTREVYFSKDAPNKSYSNDYDLDSAISRSDDTESSEFSESDVEMTTRKPKKRKQKDKKHKTKEYAVKKHKHNKKTTSIKTIFPKRLTVERVKRFKIKPTTRKDRLHTLWEEKIKHKSVKLKRSQGKTNLRTGDDKLTVIADSDTVINVKSAVVSSEENIEHKNERNRETLYTEKQPTATQSSNPKKQKILQKLSTIEYIKPGMSIESFEIERRSFSKDNTADEMKVNVMRRINQLEKQMEEVQMKIDTKITNATNNPTNWTNTTTREITTTAVTKSTNVTSETTKPSTKHVIPETTKKASNKSIDITTVKDKTTRIETTTEKKNITTPISTKTTNIVRDVKKTTPNEEKDYQENLNLPDEANDIGIDDDLDDDIDDIIKKYNISVTSIKPTFKTLVREKKSGNKEEEVKGIIENDLKNIFSTTTQKINESLTDTFDDINSLLDLGDI